MRAPASFLDGGGSKPLQRAAMPLLAEDHVVAETRAIQAAFRAKRDYLLSQLQRLGVRVDRAPEVPSTSGAASTSCPRR